ncbi:MAG: hypothetical protein ACK4K7_04010 [Allosphingosinicella sp.]|uniref:hypothetical protein n=1 Tax=Allosphingosinicella sp. TaxID=2823234 RepID=UPI00393FEB58
MPLDHDLRLLIAYALIALMATAAAAGILYLSRNARAHKRSKRLFRRRRREERARPPA